MRTKLRVLTAVIAAVMAAGGGLWMTGTASAAPNSAASAPGVILHAPLAPSLTTYDPIFGLPPGGKNWLIHSGQVTLTSRGDLRVSVAGLVFTSTGNNPVPEIAASLYCNGMHVTTTAPAPFSTLGNAHLQATVQVPSPCLVPAVVLQPVTGAGVLPVYIAFDGKA